MKQKIFFITNDLGIGGVQRLVVDFANNLDKEKFDVTVGILLARQKSYFYKDELNQDVNFINFSFTGFFDLKSWWALFTFIKKSKFDIVFTQLVMADIIGRIVAWCAGVPLIITEIQNLIPDLSKSLILINRLLVYITDICISPTPAITQYAIEVIQFPKEKVLEIPTNAIETKRFLVHIDKQQFRRDLGIPENAKIIITIGRLVEQKGHTILLRAAQEVVQKKSNTYFVIVGDGVLKSNLTKESELLGINKYVRFLGSRKNTPKLLMSSNIFVFPSLWEGQGLILFEAVFARIPIVASRTGGIPDVINDDVTGLLSPPGDYHALAENIMKILHNEQLAETLTVNAYEHFKDRTMENVVRRLEKLFVTKA